MPYLICDNCKIYYEVDENYSYERDTCENCGGRLKFYNSFDEYYGPNSYERESISVGTGYAEMKSSKYSNILLIGIILGLIGIIGYFLGFFISLIFLVIGVSLAIYGHNTGKSWNKGIKGESIVAEYLNELPKDYFIFNDVNLPNGRGNIDHIVIGPNGIF